MHQVSVNIYSPWLFEMIAGVVRLIFEPPLAVAYMGAPQLSILYLHPGARGLLQLLAC